jgi:hypothetical protein
MKTIKSAALAGGVLILAIAGYIAYLYRVPTSLPVEMKYLPTAYAAPSNAPVTRLGPRIVKPCSTSPTRPSERNPQASRP